MYQRCLLQTLIMIKIYIKLTPLGSCQNWWMQRRDREREAEREYDGKKTTCINTKWVWVRMLVAFVCTLCKSHGRVHLGPLQMNKSLPSDKLIKVPSCCCVRLTADRAGRGWDSFPGCVVYPPLPSQSSRPEVADWVRLPLSDVVPPPTWRFIIRADACSIPLDFLPKQLREWVEVSVTQYVT